MIGKDIESDRVGRVSMRDMAGMLLLGFSSGLPLPLTASTLQAWLTVSNVDIRTIGIISLAGLPYTLKFLWAPLMDRFRLPWLGRRRGWIILTQPILIISIGLVGLLSPLDAPFIIGLMALGIAFISASQDIVIDAYRTDLLMPEERGMGAGIFITGYRVAMLLAGAVALMLSEFIGWRNTYLLMAGLMIVGIGGTILAREPDTMKVAPINLKEAVSGPLRDLFLKKKAILVLVFIVLYKLGDAYAGTLTTAFLIRGAGFSPVEVGAINKGIGLMATIFGAIFGGTLMLRMSLYRSLFWFGILQMVSNLSFMGLAYAGKDYRIMVIAVLFENISGGMGSAAFMAFIMALCNKRYSATQFALLSALSALGRVFISPTSGFVVNRLGWPEFFFISTIVAIPGLACLRLLKHEIFDLKMG